MAIEIHYPGRLEFGKLHQGRLFVYNLGVYVKSSEGSATVVYKTAGLMNAGELENFTEDAIVQVVKDATFKVGDY